MQDWLSYSLSDLLLFSEQSYLRQFELYNQWLFPVQWLLYLYGAAFLIALYRRHLKVLRLLFGMTMLLWLVSGYGYLWRLYGAINWMAEYFIALFLLQVLMIGWIVILSPVWHRTGLQNKRIVSGLLLCCLTMLLQPVIEVIAGREWTRLSAFAATPDSLCGLTLAFMLALGLPARYFIPSALWLLFSVLTYMAMDNWMGLLPGSILLVYLITCIPAQSSSITPR